MKFILPLLLVAFLLSGCASAPTAEQLANADYGSSQSPEDCISVAEAVITSSLKDPTSALFTHNTCKTGYWPSVPIMGMPVQFGYLQGGTVNGKNSYGGYVGARNYSVLVKNGYAVRWCIADTDGICVPSGR